MPLVARTLAALLFMLFSAGAVLAQAQAVKPGDPVPGRDGLIYLDLIRLALPDADADRATPPAGLRHAVPGSIETRPEGRTVYNGAFALDLVSGGKPRLLLAMDFGVEMPLDHGFTVVALIGFEPEPKLLDIVNLSTGHQFYFNYPDAFGVAGQTIIVTVGYGESQDRVVNGLAATLVRNDRFEPVVAFPILSHFTCAANFNQNPVFGLAATGWPMTDFEVSVDETVEPTGQACDGEKAPEASARSIKVLYRWDLALSKYLPDSDALEKLVAETEKRFPPAAAQ